MAKKIRGGAKERNLRGRKALRAASNCVEAKFKENGFFVLRGIFSRHLASRYRKLKTVRLTSLNESLVTPIGAFT
jgi:hypothetical protein